MSLQRNTSLLFLLLLASCASDDSGYIIGSPPSFRGDNLIGKIAYNVPQSMTVGKVEVFEVRLTLHSSAVIVENFIGVGEIKTDTLELTGRVTVKLV